VATNAPTPLVGNGSGQIPLGRVAFGRMMATDEIERADKAAVIAAIARAAFYPALAITGNRARREEPCSSQPDSDELFEMASLFPRTTRLPMTVRVSPRGS
jgi:hypothetical protein